ncbi:MAG: DUF2207 domain-containing protein [Nanoarchaeota archaeon]|nr:DUF2207 domain-containing protein [Nanoarchaeota archaeon]
MKESVVVALICVLLLIGGGVFAYFSAFKTDFNFYKSELKILANNVSEKLSFQPDKDYHTLYRNFFTPITFYETDSGDSIKITNVECEKGTAYANSYSECAYFDGQQRDGCLAYTEANEYGCSFGNSFGFNRGRHYIIHADYELSARTIFIVKDRPYIKFVAYSSKHHPYLERGDDFLLEGNVVSKSRYFPSQNVILYVPYQGSLENKTLVYLKDFEYDNPNYLYSILLALLPAALFFTVWYFFGKERSYADLPENLSYPPKERKAWEVAAFFSPPFNVVDNNFFSSILLDFYHRKIIDIKMKEGTFSKKTLIKLKPCDKSSLDLIERKFLEILEMIEKKAQEDDKEEGYVDFVKAAKRWSIKYKVMSDFQELNKQIKKIGREYVETNGNAIMLSSFLVLFFFYIIVFEQSPDTIFFFMIAAVLIFGSSLLAKGALFTRHKKEYYIEYQHWKAFKEYLEAAPSIKAGTHKSVVLWNKYLIWALALGISKKALKELHSRGIINEGEYHASLGTMHFSGSFSTATGKSGSGGGFGGAGGGGMGGGGGGGR